MQFWNLFQICVELFLKRHFEKNFDDFHDLLWLPEAMIIYCMKYK